MTERRAVLIVGTSETELEALCAVASSVVDAEAELHGLEVPPGSSDPGLAWGTEQVHVREFVAATPDGLGAPVAQPLGEDGDVWKAVLAAAHRLGVGVIVMTSVRQRWFRRVWIGSAAHDLLSFADLPVLAVPERVLAARGEELVDDR